MVRPSGVFKQCRRPDHTGAPAVLAAGDGRRDTTAGAGQGRAVSNPDPEPTMSRPTTACIGLGANIGHPRRAVRDALDALATLPQTRLVAASRLYRSGAWGHVNQPDFVNAAAVVETELEPATLLAQLLAIERAAGRDRQGETASLRWGPRVLDLDLLLFAECVINEPGLRVPHPHLHERAFALVPLAEIAPDQSFPGHGTVAEALRLIDASGVEPISDG